MTRAVLVALASVAVSRVEAPVLLSRFDACCSDAGVGVVPPKLIVLARNGIPAR